jgi:type I restriction enzyme R subunit
MSRFTEDVVEQAALVWLQSQGYELAYGPEIAPGERGAERERYEEALLPRRLRAALERLNPDAPEAAREEAFRLVRQHGGADLMEANRRAHRWLTDGVEVEVPTAGGEMRGHRLDLVNWDDPRANDLLAVNQFTVKEGPVERRPDVVVFVNGLPLAVFELKNAADERATVWTAWQQLQTYQKQIPSLFVWNEVQVISDGVEARLGTVGTPRERFLPWKTADGEAVASASDNALEVLIRGVFAPWRFLDLVRRFVAYEADAGGTQKKVAAYHQYHAANKAVTATLTAARAGGSGQGGVVWHTQGSGKSLTMAFFAGKLIGEAALENPTIVVLTDRTDLDGQLFGTFSRTADLFRQTPEQAESREDLRAKLTRTAGGVVFTTIQKFYPDEKGGDHPELTDRRNVVVLADEAHRSQYDFVDGYARHIRSALPNATFVGFTGTPLELDDKDTRLVFGNYIDVYDVERAVEDGATVPIYYESRLAKLDLPDDEKPRLDEGFEEVMEGEEETVRRGQQTKWGRLEALVGTEKRLRQVAADLVEHFETRTEAVEGKGMIVCMSRRICVALYDEIVALRPQWHAADDAEGAIKVVMTGSATDPEGWQGHIRSKRRREDLAARFKDPGDPLRLVIVRDMWLTGFDAPVLHTLYADKPMRGHSLMQAIARVNRVFRDKPGGLIVDYIGLASNLQEALGVYANSGGRGKTTVSQDEAVAVLLEKLDVCQAFFHGFDYTPFLTGNPADRLRIIPAAQEHLYRAEREEPGTLRRFLTASLALQKAFALAAPREEALEVRDEVVFVTTIRGAVSKTKAPSPQAKEDLDGAVRQLVETAIAPEGVVDVFAAAGLSKPDISILSDGFLAEVRDLPQKNLAVALLERLLNDEVRSKRASNLRQAKAFSEKLGEAVTRYHNRSIETARVIEELLALAREMREAASRGEALNLTDEEVAFYDALEVNDSAVSVLGDEQLRDIARDLAKTVREHATIDWSVREQVRANMRRYVRRVLRRHGYPPDKQEQATATVIEQAELMGRGIADT